MRGVLDTIRTRILDFALAIEETDPLAGDRAPGEPPGVSPSQGTTIFNTTIINGQANIGTRGNAAIKVKTYALAGVPESKRQEIEPLLQQLLAEADRAPIQDRDEARHVVDKIGEQLSLAAPDAERVDNYLGIYASLLTVASPTLEALKVALSFLFG